MADTLPEAVRDRVLAIARQERSAPESRRQVLEHRRGALLADHGYASRIRRDEDGAVLVCYPDDWLEAGTVDTDRIEDLDRAIELPLDRGDQDADWAEIAAANEAIADRVNAEHGQVHGANAARFVAFMNDHRGRKVETATEADIEEFLTEYYPRNAWPNDRERAAVESSIEKLLALANGDEA